MANSSITVSLKLFGDLRKYVLGAKADSLPMPLPSGATIADLIAEIGIDAHEEVIAAVNGEQAGRGSILNDGDQVMLVSPMEGG
jgi:sulfur carrier protein ThiS